MNDNVTTATNNPSSDELTGSKDSLKRYVREISEENLLSIEEECRLAKQIHGKNKKRREAARETLIRANLRLVVKIAHNFRNFGLPLNDLISEGNIGLMHAVDKFDPAKGAKFSTYSAWWIKQAMRRALANQRGMIRIPVQTKEKMAKIIKTEYLLLDKLGRNPSDGEIAEVLNYPVSLVTWIRNSKYSIISLDSQITEDSNSTFSEIIADQVTQSPDQQCAEADTIALLHASIQKLDRREQTVLRLRFFQKKTLEYVSDIIGCTRERVRQIQREALEKLRESMHTEAATA